jgi:hypothetical protein
MGLTNILSVIITVAESRAPPSVTLFMQQQPVHFLMGSISKHMQGGARVTPGGAAR